MIEAYILVNVKPGKEKDLVENLTKEIGNSLISADIVYGEYDVILKVRIESFNELRNTVVEKIRKLDYVERTITLIVAS
ncbi:Lrp/AsnC family transcriptional regulator [Nanoarchaeota archaeon NZ13-N]|uniref:Transcription regulator AsnC/Lrp ligand binding domain-containing protein n=1 Tax=Candidatus Nanoclepta minutus TaxID=1940235 RepID=A0A397WMH2_9ARCH|nr:MAG: Lrp/AsnC family transcriptional regulator [Nanoarchaeota archaeon NZ13-N]RIB35284.1 MAG: hypothetical protein BXU00_02000 [Candidatus Nanoclepta minutus]